VTIARPGAPRRVFYHEERKPVRRERTPEELAKIRELIAGAEYGFAREEAMRGAGRWPTVPEDARAQSAGALANPYSTLARRRTELAELGDEGDDWDELWADYVSEQTEGLRRP
jgi:hypothetical protein